MISARYLGICLLSLWGISYSTFMLRSFHTYNLADEKCLHEYHQVKTECIISYVTVEIDGSNQTLRMIHLANFSDIRFSKLASESFHEVGPVTCYWDELRKLPPLIKPICTSGPDIETIKILLYHLTWLFIACTLFFK